MKKEEIELEKFFHKLFKLKVFECEVITEYKEDGRIDGYRGKLKYKLIDKRTGKTILDVFYNASIKMLYIKKFAANSYMDIHKHFAYLSKECCAIKYMLVKILEQMLEVKFITKNNQLFDKAC